jgi:hypothetical protein
LATTCKKSEQQDAKPNAEIYTKWMRQLGRLLGETETGLRPTLDDDDE